MAQAAKMGSLSAGAGALTLVPTSRFRLPSSAASVYLDALRGVAAFGVLVHHWVDIFSFGVPTQFSRRSPEYWLHAILGLGHQWVLIFFVLSGYLVGGTVLRSVAAGRWSLRKYALTRGTRLYIVLIPALLLGGLIDRSGIHYLHASALYLGQTDIASVHFDVASRLHLSTWLENAFFLQTIRLPFTHNPIPAFGSNGPLWSLAYEFWFYIGFPLLVFAVKPASRLSTRIVCILLLVLWVVFTGPAISLLWFIWLMGVALNFVPPIPEFHDHFGFTISTLTLVAAILLLKAAHPLGEMVGLIYWTDFVFGGVVTVFLFALIHWEGHYIPPWTASLSRHAALGSYTLYLVHLPALVFLRGLLQPPSAGQPSSFNPGYACLALIVVVAYAQLVYYLFERNTDQVRKWLTAFPGKRPLAGASVPS